MCIFHIFAGQRDLMQRVSEGDVASTTFDDALERIVELMAHDSYLRFEKSDVYSQLNLPPLKTALQQSDVRNELLQKVLSLGFVCCLCASLSV